MLEFLVELVVFVFEQAFLVLKLLQAFEIPRVFDEIGNDADERSVVRVHA